MLLNQLVHKLAAKNTPPFERSKTIEGELRERAGFAEPNSVRQSESMLGFADRLRRQEIFHGALEKISQPHATHFELAGQDQRKIEQLIVEERVCDIDLRSLAHLRDFAQIIIGQRDLPVQIQHTIHERRPQTCAVAQCDVVTRHFDVDALEKFALKHLSWSSHFQEIVCIKSRRHRNASLLYV